jgi:hypothetical protein
MNVDPSGRFFWLFFIPLIFAVANVAVQVVEDVVEYIATGTWESSWEDYTGAFLGGLAGGVTFIATGFNLTAAFAATDFVESFSTDILTNATGKTNYSFGDMLVKSSFNALIGSGFGKLLGNTSKVGITAGKNSFMAVFKSGTRKLINQTASRMSIKVTTKGFTALVYSQAFEALLKGFSTGNIELLKRLYK